MHKKLRRLPVTGGMKVNAYRVLSRAVEEGTDYGWTRAHKHTDKPDEDGIKEEVVQAVINEICEYFKFDEPEEE